MKKDLLTFRKERKVPEVMLLRGEESGMTGVSARGARGKAAAGGCAETTRLWAGGTVLKHGGRAGRCSLWIPMINHHRHEAH